MQGFWNSPFLHVTAPRCVCILPFVDEILLVVVVLVPLTLNDMKCFERDIIIASVTLAVAKKPKLVLSM